MTDSVLRTSLLDLHFELSKKEIPLILGGGYGLFLKQTETNWAGALPLIDPSKWPMARSTEDLDVFLIPEVVGNSAHMDGIRKILDDLGYEPIVKHFQFKKDSATANEVKVDLLAGPVPDSYRKIVKVSKPRARNREAQLDLHAYVTEEALSLNEKLVELTITGNRSTGEDYSALIKIPNPFTFILMKLHAFFDRANDRERDEGRHHALDLYRIIAMLTNDELKIVQNLIDSHASAVPCQQASYIVKTCFCQASAKGAVRLQEHPSFSTDMELKLFIQTLIDLFAETNSLEKIPKERTRYKSDLSSEGMPFKATAETVKFDPVTRSARRSEKDLQNWLAHIEDARSEEDALALLNEFRKYYWSEQEATRIFQVYLARLEKIRAGLSET